MSSKENQQQAQKIEIEKHIVIDASPEVVFKAITDPKELTNWFPDQAILEAKVGGKVKFSFYKEEGQHGDCSGATEGTIIEFIPNKKVSYTWEKHNTPDFPRTVVTWKLEKIDDGRTRVNLLHTGFESGKLFKHDEGWSYFLDRLRKYCEKK
jgi:uncharacterized protein YndB with AHSA1/START domain